MLIVLSEEECATDERSRIAKSKTEIAAKAKLSFEVEMWLKTLSF